MSSPEYKYTSRFLAKAHVIQPTDALYNEAKASLVGLSPLLPSSINPEDHPDLLFVVANLAVAGVTNLNDDSMSLEDALATYKRFEMKLCDIEHDRKTIVGFILKAGLSELGTNRLISAEEARKADRPFNITTVTVLWKVANRELCSFIQESGVPGSPENDSLSLSFEVGFNDYDIITLPKGVTDLARVTHTIASDSPDFDRYDRLLRVNKGKGIVKETGERVARILSGKIVPLGEGIVTVPAAAVKGLLPLLGNDSDYGDEIEATEGPHEYSSTHVQLPEEYASAFRQFAASIPNDQLYTGEEGSDSYGPSYGREMDVHATILYGLKSADADCIAPHIANHGHITACLGAVSAFENEDKPYDVLKCDVDSPDFHKLHEVIKANTDCNISWPTYTPHVTIAYTKKGMAKHYVGDTRFSGIKMTFDSLIFSPHSGDKTTLPLTTKADDSVYSSLMNRIKLSQGWKERFAAFVSKDPLVNAVTVTLSDGRVLKNVHVFNGEELELDKTLSMEGVIITDMTPGNPPQLDDSKIIHPHIGDVFPTVRPEKQAEDAVHLAEIKEAQKAAYTDAALMISEAFKKISDVIASQTCVSQVTSENHPMNLDKLNQVKASLEKGDTKEAVASITVLADEIAKASETWSKNQKAAEDRFTVAEKAREEAVAASKLVEAKVVELEAKLTDMRNAQASAEAEAKFQARMAAFAEAFDVSEDAIAVLIEDIKACATDESFAKFMDKSKKLGLKKKVKADDMDASKKDDKKKAAKDAADDGDDDDAKAAVEAIASAKANVIDSDIHNNIDANLVNETTLERMQRVFARDTNIDGVSVSARVKKSKKDSE